MKDETIIAITNVFGSRSYTINDFIKKIFLYFIILILMIMIIGGLTTYALSKKIKQYAQLESEYSELENRNSNLSHEIQSKELQFANVSQKVADIEQMVGMTQNNDIEIDERLDLAQISAAERVLMVTLLPSGPPIKFEDVSSRFGWRPNPVGHEEKEFHVGIDLQTPTNTPVNASADGVVDFSKESGKSGYGRVVVINHAFGFRTLYAHLSKVVVDDGDFVTKGQIIAYSGTSGNSNGPHLHYEVRYGNMSLDPMNFIRWDLQRYEEIFARERRIKWQSLASGIKWQLALLEQLSSPKAQAL